MLQKLGLQLERPFKIANSKSLRNTFAMTYTRIYTSLIKSNIVSDVKLGPMPALFSTIYDSQTWNCAAANLNLSFQLFRLIFLTF